MGAELRTSATISAVSLDKRIIGNQTGKPKSPERPPQFKPSPGQAALMAKIFFAKGAVPSQ
jgi:hypothetical protein